MKGTGFHVFFRILASRLTGVAAAASLALASVPGSAEAQYFGRNKVQYDDLDFQVLRTSHFDVYFHDEEEKAARIAARMAERWYARLSSLLGHELTGQQPLILYASHPEFQQTNVISGLPSEGTGGVTESLKRRIVLPMAGPLAETDHVIGHELVHAFQFDIMSQSRSAVSSSFRLPLWFTEGMAEYLSIGPVASHTALWMRQAVLHDDLPTLDELSDPRYFPYRYGHALWAYVAGRAGDEAVGRALKAAIEGGAGAVGAIETVMEADAETVSASWHDAIRSAYAGLLEDPTGPEDYGRALVTDEQHGGTLNVAPSLSPDGSRMIFLSERDLFSIEMFLADAETGEVKSTIVETATDPHFESLQFIHSSGDWSPDGSQFVFAGVSEGDPVLSFLDVDRGEVQREIAFDELGEIFNPSWSPDGRYVVFSAIEGGLLDLYRFDREEESLERLTEDVFAELHPDWSPDGTRIVFTTDRFSTRVPTLAFGHYELATMDALSGEDTIRRVPVFPGSDHWNPQWAEDGLYFVSDRDGRPNLYRLDGEGDGVHAVTELAAGISGITKLSPAVTAAARGQKVLFTARREQEYRIYAIESAEVLRGRPVAVTAPERSWAVLPPERRGPSRVASWSRRPTEGLPRDGDYPIRDYDASLNLDYVGRPYLVAGSDRFSSFVGGGISFFFSDMLGNHQLGTQLQVNGDFEDIAAIAGYENRASRWNWGGVASQIPFVSGRFTSGVAEVDGQAAVVEQLILLRQTERRASGVVSYPFNRARRLEFTGGFRNIGFSREADTTAVSLQTGQVLVDDTFDLDAPSDLNLGQTSAAMVYDTSLFGPTSPLVGTRYRVETGATLGSIQFSDVLADFRHYTMPLRPFTIAGRAMHFGRYGGDAEDPRLTDLFLGYPNLVRGYQAGSFDAAECRSGPGCPVFDQLLGSRLLVTNVELRFPLMGALGRDAWYDPLPVEIAFFGDAGVAWTGDTSPSLFGGERETVTSAGVAVRVALQRFLILELDFVRPFDRPQKSWVFEFNFKPGF